MRYTWDRTEGRELCGTHGTDGIELGGADGRELSSDANGGDRSTWRRYD